MRCSRLHSRSHSAWAFDIASRVLAGGFDGGLRKEPTPRGEMVGDRGCASSQARLRAAVSDAAMAAKICYPIVVHGTCRHRLRYNWLQGGRGNAEQLAVQSWYVCLLTSMVSLSAWVVSMRDCTHDEACLCVSTNHVEDSKQVISCDPVPAAGEAGRDSPR